MTRAQRRIDISAQNISNIATSGYKRSVDFPTILASGSGSGTEIFGLSSGSIPDNTVFDFTPGKRMDTGVLTDLAILGDGFFCIQGNDGLFYTRAGHFERGADGRLLTHEGFSLQSQSGGDLKLEPGAFQVQADGTVMQGGQAVGRIAVVDFADRLAITQLDGGLFATSASNVKPVDAPAVDQGSLEASNVSTAVEMIDIMSALRSAQAGAKLANVYDDLLGRAITTFGGQG
ncbi:MAG TPA: flagellar hook-basal body complex protein [Caulobacteraceae bacterium]|jgi:flagellar basal-body rod protein FlgG|nr:flagellar hook-basal body complex protein [Caulobacteraceae bacterium]